MDAGLTWSVIGAAAAIVVWAVRLEGRQNNTERELADFKQEVREDIGYIRDRIDTAINGRH